MRGKVVLGLVGALLLAGCGGDENEVADTSEGSTTAARGDPIVIRTEVVIAAEEGAEVIATGEVLDGSMLGDSTFCVGGTIRDAHGSTDPEVFVIARTIACPDGRLRVELTPDVDGTEGETQTGSWRIVGATDAFTGLRGSGKMEVVYGPDEASPPRETLTGTVTR